jgi:hypothetical protein
LAREPAERYSSAVAFADALNALELDPLAQTYAALQEAMAGEKWPAALALAETILAQDRSYKDVRRLLEQAVQEGAAEDNAKLVADWREQAISALVNGDWDTAVVAAKQWLILAPDTEALPVLNRALEGQARADEQPSLPK